MGRFDLRFILCRQYLVSGDVIKFAPIGESHELVIRAPDSLAKYIARYVERMLGQD